MVNIESSIERILKISLKLLEKVREMSPEDRYAQEMLMYVSEIIRTCHELEGLDTQI